MKCFYALCLIGRSDPENKLITKTISIMLPYQAFNKTKYVEVLNIYKTENYQMMLTDGFSGLKKQNTKKEWETEIQEIERYLEILNSFVSERKSALVQQMTYSMHNFPIAIYKNDKEKFEEFWDNKMLKMSINQELMDSWK